ncbi:hypothetical protein [Micromonospora sp. NPDC005367]|uniref:hypothetical protein n=1 Tax=Micromonospora sp. NPDC005367 TaxID=3155590 RepID=UPI0033A8E284
MAHVELSLSEVFVPAAQAPTEPECDNFDRWSSTVTNADEPCLLIDADANVVAISTATCRLLSLGEPDAVIGLPLLSGGLRLLDFTANRNALTQQEIDKIPPLLALSSGRLARGLLRVQAATPKAPVCTVDAISTAVFTDDAVAGSLTFFSPV